MEALKSFVFLFSLTCTFLMVEDIIEKIIMYLKKTEEDFHSEYTYGLTNLGQFWPTALTILGWTGLYFLSLL